MVTARQLELATLAVACCAVVASTFLPLADSIIMQIIELLCAIVLIISMIAQFLKSGARPLLPYFAKMGLLCLVVSLLLGNYFTFSYKTLIINELHTDVAVNKANKLVQLPFSLSLSEIAIESYPSGNAKQVCAKLQVADNQGVTELLCAPNKPANYRGFDIYLEKFTPTNAQFLLVRQPCKWLTWAGIFLLAIFAVGTIFYLPKKGGKSD